MLKFAVILAAAGQSSRFGDVHRKKPFVDLKGRAVWLRSLEVFSTHPSVEQKIVVVSPDDLDWFKEKFQPNLAFGEIQVVAGGRERADSVERGLAALNANIDFVAIHDAARPLMTRSWVDAVFSAATESQAAILATPIRGTIKRAATRSSPVQIQETISREGLWEAQTPQVFSRALIEQAYAERGGFVATDEAQLVERLGHPVRIVECSAMNLKITTQDDLRMAGALLDALPKEKTLRPLHPFADERPDLFS